MCVDLTLTYIYVYQLGCSRCSLTLVHVHIGTHSKKKTKKNNKQNEYMQTECEIIFCVSLSFTALTWMSTIRISCRRSFRAAHRNIVTIDLPIIIFLLHLCYVIDVHILCSLHTCFRPNNKPEIIYKIYYDIFGNAAKVRRLLCFAVTFNTNTTNAFVTARAHTSVRSFV